VLWWRDADIWSRLSQVCSVAGPPKNDVIFRLDGRYRRWHFDVTPRLTVLRHAAGESAAMFTIVLMYSLVAALVV
jgi:hypothetical protein